jgi:hypothetical protein
MRIRGGGFNFWFQKMRYKIVLCAVLLMWPCSAGAYVDHFQLYTLRAVIEQSPDVAVVRVDKVSRENGVIVFSKVADLKGSAAGGLMRLRIAGGVSPSGRGMRCP